ncbi:MAG: universal stress protein, partial [Planctomycetaceae bacterium]|nr:universal stress protein [Planctomycetaceae bacterium]
VPSPEFAASPDSDEGRPYALRSQEDPGEASLDKVVPTVPGVACSHRLLSGDPAEELLGLATAESVDLIVMGTHGHTALAKLLLGSVAEAIVNRAACPVITVKLPREPVHG